MRSAIWIRNLLIDSYVSISLFFMALLDCRFHLICIPMYTDVLSESQCCVDSKRKTALVSEIGESQVHELKIKFVHLRAEHLLYTGIVLYRLICGLENQMNVKLPHFWLSLHFQCKLTCLLGSYKSTYQV